MPVTIKEPMGDPKQRIRQTIKHLPTDRVPKGELLIEDAVVSQLLRSPFTGFAERLMFCRQLEQDLICLQPEPVYPERDLPDPETVKWPDLNDWVEKSNLFTMAMLDGVIGWGTKIFGYTEFLILPKRSPLQFADFATAVNRFNSKLAERMIAKGIDGLLLADDLAYQKGLLFRREMLREQIFPSMAGVVSIGRQAGIPVFMHSDGDLTEIMSDIIEAGFNGLHCLDKNSGMNPSELQRLYGRDLCLWGGLAVEDLEEAEEWNGKAMVTEVNNLHANGGFILGTNSGLFDGINIRNLMKLYSELSNGS